MKKKIFKLMCMLLVVFSLTGCTKYINNDKNKVIKNEANGQNVVKNILCKPTDKKLLSIYDDYNKKNALPSQVVRLCFGVKLFVIILWGNF